MNIIQRNFIKKYANSQRTNNIISWDEVKNYIDSNYPQILNKEKWESTGLFDNMAVQGFFGYIVINGQTHYFVQDFFQYRDNEHAGENFTISAVTEIDSSGTKISQTEFVVSNDTAIGMKNTRVNCNGYEVILTDAKSLDDLVKGKFKNIN